MQLIMNHVLISSTGRFSSLSKRREQFWGTSSHIFNECRETFSQGLKQLQCKADHSPQSSAEGKNEWTYSSTPPYAFMAYMMYPLYQSCRKNVENWNMINISSMSEYNLDTYIAQGTMCLVRYTYSD
jgi:hypothetical protein